MARTDPHEQESVVLRPDLDALVESDEIERRQAVENLDDVQEVYTNALIED